jgi:hypothetical protein
MRAQVLANPTQHVLDIRQRILGVVQQARASVNEVGEPRAQALFETTAEMLKGLAKAYEDYNTGTEEPWRH